MKAKQKFVVNHPVLRLSFRIKLPDYPSRGSFQSSKVSNIKLPEVKSCQNASMEDYKIGKNVLLWHFVTFGARVVPIKVSHDPNYFKSIKSNRTDLVVRSSWPDLGVAASGAEVDEEHDEGGDEPGRRHAGDDTQRLQVQLVLRVEARVHRVERYVHVRHRVEHLKEGESEMYA